MDYSIIPIWCETFSGCKVTVFARYINDIGLKIWLKITEIADLSPKFCSCFCYLATYQGIEPPRKPNIKKRLAPKCGPLRIVAVLTTTYQR
jgi:hypothetical protein